MTRRRIRLVRQGFPDPPARDTAISHAILRRVSDGLEEGTLSDSVLALATSLEPRHMPPRD